MGQNCWAESRGRFAGQNHWVELCGTITRHNHKAESQGRIPMTEWRDQFVDQNRSVLPRNRLCKCISNHLLFKNGQSNDFKTIQTWWKTFIRSINHNFKSERNRSISLTVRFFLLSIIQDQFMSLNDLKWLISCSGTNIVKTRIQIRELGPHSLKLVRTF